MAKKPRKIVSKPGSITFWPSEIEAMEIASEIEATDIWPSACVAH